MELSRKGKKLFWPGFCTEIVTTRSVIGIKELLYVCAEVGNKVRSLKETFNRFWLADTLLDSVGQEASPLATPCGNESITVTLDVVPADIPALLGMDILDRECLIAETVPSRLKKRKKYHDQARSPGYFDEWHVSFFRSRGNRVYAEMDCPTILRFTRSKLHKLHK